jgi:hypothetical protein
MGKDLDFLLWRMENDKVYKEGGRTDKELRASAYGKKAWRLRRRVRISFIPRALVLGAMQAMPNVEGTYPMPNGANVVAKRLMASIAQVTNEPVMEVSTLALWKGLHGWATEIQEFMDWKDMENCLDLESVLYNAACCIEAETGWVPRQRFLDRQDERQDWQQIKLVHISLVPQALTAGVMLETAVKDVQSKQGSNWPLPPYVANVIKWVNYNLKEQLAERYVASEILRISPFLLMESMKGWLTSNPYYMVWAKMGKQSLDLDALLVRSISWLNVEVNVMMDLNAKPPKTPKTEPERQENEEWGDPDNDDLLESLKI